MFWPPCTAAQRSPLRHINHFASYLVQTDSFHYPVLSLDPTCAVLGQNIGGRHTTKFDALVVGQLVESLKPEVESARGGIDSENIDSLVNVTSLVA
jgi:hypothetical protein